MTAGILFMTFWGNDNSAKFLPTLDKLKKNHPLRSAGIIRSTFEDHLENWRYHSNGKYFFYPTRIKSTTTKNVKTAKRNW